MCNGESWAGAVSGHVVAGPRLLLAGPTVSRVSEACHSAAMQRAPGLWQEGQALVPLAGIQEWKWKTVLGSDLIHGQHSVTETGSG